MTELQTDIPVLIVGAGPTGLTLGIELARRGVPFRLIDRELNRTVTSRALGTQPRTVEVFQMMGIPVSALQPATRPRGFQFREGLRILGKVDFNDPHGQPALLIMDESDTERVLEARLDQLGAHVERGVEFTGLRAEGDRAIAAVRSSNGVAEVSARFLIGCDGAASIVRREAGIDFVGGSYPEHFLLADLELDWDVPHDEGTIWFGDQAGLAAAIPLPADRRWRIIVALGLDEADRAHFSESEAAARVEQELRERSQIACCRIGEPHWASAFHVHRKLAVHFRRGPILLAGDAAHVHSPVGGQGMNTGIQDAFNLGWKLALAARNLAAPDLLDSYETERQPVARAVLRGTDLGARLVLGAHPIGRAIREYVFPTVTGFSPVRDRLQSALSELQVNYRHSSLSVESGTVHARRGIRRRHGLRAGDRVPDAHLLDAPSAMPVTVFERFAQGWTLLAFPTEPRSEETAPALSRIAALTREMAGDLVRLDVVAERTDGEPVTGSSLLDLTGEVRRRFGVERGQLLLVRPDGYLGFRGRIDRPGELASYLARIFAMRLREATTLA